MTWQDKLNPARFPGMSSRMAALVAPIIGRDDLTTPVLVDFCVTSDGMLLAREPSDCGYNHFIGPVDDFERNWNNLLVCAGLQPEELEAAERARGRLTLDYRS